jgi:hypothetical protein
MPDIKQGPEPQEETPMFATTTLATAPASAHAAPAFTPAALAACVTPAVPIVLAGDDDEAPPAGCGWFDSSLELSRGLAVVEHTGFDAISDATPLAWQLAAWL